MSTIVLDNLHLADDPHARLAQAARTASISLDGDPQRLIVRVPNLQTNGIRAYRVDDIARLLHRHGQVLELGVTDGGTICAAVDVRERRGELAIWTGWAIGPWHPSDILQRGLGGSETAAVRLAEQFAEMGWAVTLYGQFESEGLAGDVILRDHRSFDPTEHLDALIVFRDARQLDHRPNADFVALWLEDLAPAEGLTPARAKNCDRICGVTNWHKGQILSTYPWLDPDQVAGCRNGIVTEWYREEPAPERQKRVVYSSSPDRGGDIVLECWPKVREQVPDAELILTYPRWFEICADTFQAANSHRERLRELVQQDGVRRLDQGMGQKALAGLLRSSMVWCNPGYYTPAAQKFEETSCITSLEAQAAGCVVVAANWGALTESVQHGTLIDGDPGDPDGAFRHAFVDAIVRGLTDETTQLAAQTIGPEMVRDMDWRGAAEQVAAMMVPDRVPANYGAIYR